MFSYEQAIAVTEEQQSALRDVQRTALAMVLTPWENRPVDFRGKNKTTLTLRKKQVRGALCLNYTKLNVNTCVFSFLMPYVVPHIFALIYICTGLPAGRSMGLALSHSPLCLILGQLMLLTVLLCPDS